MSENVAGQVGNVIISDAKVSSGNTGISLLQSSPGSVKFHRIEDRELEAMVNMNSPLTFGICTTAAGAFLGLIPSVVSIF